MNQEEFEQWFPTNQHCLDYLIELRWPNGFRCPVCSSDFAWQLKSGVFMCRNCDRKTSVTSGTIFHRARLPLTTWFRAVWWMVAQKNGVSALGLQKVLGIGSYETAWTWLHKFRRVMIIPGRDRLRGIVEVDETLVGGPGKGKRGRGSEGKILVGIAVEINESMTGRVRLSVLKSASGKTLNEFISNNIEPGSHVVTDGWLGYSGVRSIGYQHEIQDKKLQLGDEEILPNVHRTAALLKRWLLGTHHGGMSPHQLPFYLDEFAFRHNRRTSTSRGLLFRRILEQAVIQKPSSYAEIVAGHHI